MIKMKTAEVSDIQTILNIIKQMNDDDLKYLRYTEEADSLIARLIKNVNENHVVLFLEDEQVFGFIEYELTDNETKLWVFSLYLKPEYRKQGYALDLINTYRKLPKEQQLTIEYTVHEDNKPMLSLTHLMKGHEVRKDPQGFITVRVDMEDVIWTP